MSKPEDEAFLSRWSRRKRGGALPSEQCGEATTPSPTPEIVEQTGSDAAEPVASAPVPVGKPEADREPLDLSTLPRVDEMLPHTDITAFLDARVPAALRNAALSRMWTLDPTIRDFIEVAENQWNWNVPGGAPFYEEMLPGSGAGTLIADATSAISRSLGVAPAAEPVAAPASVEVENLSSLDGNQAMSEDIASQNDQIAERDSPAAPEDPLAMAIASEPLPTTATHHEAIDAPPPRRRHGSALPA